MTVRDQGAGGVSGVADGVDSLHEADSEDAVGTASQPVDGSTENGIGHLSQPQRPEPDAVAELIPDPMAVLASSVDDLAEQVRAYHARAQARERVIDQLHAEIERLRVGEQGLLLRPIVTDLQRLRSDLLHHATTLCPQIDQPRVVALLESFALSVELTLERCGSVPIRPSVCARFSVREHRAVELVAAESPDEDGTIAAIVADGYLDTRTERITTPARVRVRRWTPPEEPHLPVPVVAADVNRSEQQENNADV